MADLKFPSEAAAPLRQLAASLKFTITRGVGAHEVGNIGAMMAAIAEAYESDPDAVQVLLLQVLDKRQSAQAVNAMIAEKGAIIL